MLQRELREAKESAMMEGIESLTETRTKVFIFFDNFYTSIY